MVIPSFIRCIETAQASMLESLNFKSMLSWVCYSKRICNLPPFFSISL